MTFELSNTPYPDGTTVYAYDATNYDHFPGANPPGDPVEEATASNYAVTFNEVEDGVPYVAAGEVGGEWRYIRFLPDAASPNALALHEADTTDVHGIADTNQLANLSALTGLTLFYANFASNNPYEFAEQQANDERITIEQDEELGEIGVFEVREGDPEVAGGNRAEVRDGNIYQEGDDILFDFRVKYVEGDLSKFHIVFQLHDQSSGSPPLSVMFREEGDEFKSEGEKLFLFIGPGDSSAAWYRVEITEAPEAWMNLLFRVKVSATEGELEVRRDGVLQELVNGETVMTGLDTKGEIAVYSKCGLYRSKEVTGTSKVKIEHLGIMKRLVS